MQVLKNLGSVPSQISYNGRNVRRNAHTLPTSRQTGHTVRTRQTKVSSEQVIFTHTYMYHMTSEFSISLIPRTGVKCCYYCVCCRDDDYRVNEKPRITKRNYTTRTPATNSMQLAYLESMLMSSLAKVSHIHTQGINPAPRNRSFYHYPQSTRERVSLQLSQGIPAKRIVQGNKFRSSL